MRLALALAFVLLTVGTAHAEDGRVEALTNPLGVSLSQSPRVANFATPMVELRATATFDSTGDWLAADTGFALLVLPEHVVEMRVAARLYPWRLTDAGAFRRALYLRPGAHTLMVIEGFDAGPDIELGLAPTFRDVSLVLGTSLSAYVRNPRVVAELRFGVGFLF